MIEHLDGTLELLWGCEALPFETYERHQHLSATRVADDKLLNMRVDDVLAKEALRLRKLLAGVAAQNQTFLAPERLRTLGHRRPALAPALDN